MGEIDRGLEKVGLCGETNCPHQLFSANHSGENEKSMACSTLGEEEIFMQSLGVKT